MIVAVRLKAQRAEVNTSAFVTAGFESEEEEIVLLIRLAGLLCQPRGFQEARYTVAGLAGISTIRLPGRLGYR